MKFNIKDWTIEDWGISNKYESIHFFQMQERINNNDKLIEQFKELLDVEYDKGVSLIPDETYSITFEPRGSLNPKNKIKHIEIMGGIRFVTTVQELEVWATKTYPDFKLYSKHFIVQPKYDGCALSQQGYVLDHDEPFVTEILSRGDRVRGNTIFNLPHVADMGSRFYHLTTELLVRGELVCSYSLMKKINEERLKKGLKPYTHPRAVATAALAEHTNDDPLISKLTVYNYEDDWGFSSHPNVLGKPTKQYTMPNNAEKLITLLKRVTTGDIPCDGIVIKPADSNYRVRTIADSTWCIALKPKVSGLKTHIIRTVHQTSALGVVTPVIHHTPITIGGKQLTKVSGHNNHWCRERGCGIGAEIKIGLAGGVTPNLIEVVKPVRYYPPVTCEDCSSILVPEHKNLVCLNTKCPAQTLGRAKYFYGSTGLNIKGLGITILREVLEDEVPWHKLYDLVDKGYIHTKSVLEEIQRLDNSRLVSNLISAMHWRNVSVRGSIKLSIAVEGVFENLHLLTAEEISDILGWKNERSVLLVEEIKASKEITNYWAEYPFTTDEIEEDGVLAGEVVSITSTDKKAPKKFLERHIARLGGLYIPNINKTTTILIYGERTFAINPKGTDKYQRAKANGAVLIPVDEFIAEHIGDI